LSRRRTSHFVTLVGTLVVLLSFTGCGASKTTRTASDTTVGAPPTTSSATSAPATSVPATVRAAKGAPREGPTTSVPTTSKPMPKWTPPATQGPAAPPATEGTGPGPTLPRSSGTSVSVPGLPIGGDGSAVATSNGGNDACFGPTLAGPLPSGVVLTVTDVPISPGFAVVSPATAGCPATANPPCLQGRFTSADNGGVCDFGVQSKGTPPSSGTFQLSGTLSCPNLSLASCESVETQLVSPPGGGIQLSVSFSWPPSVS
jgi:hypothetical protein